MMRVLAISALAAWVACGFVGVPLWCRTQGVKFRSLTDVLAWFIMSFLTGPLALKAWWEERRK